ncbi:hypothetical protein PRK78_006574 [Emydomyces testavorans]|uniref:Uncharacterized protein n=1 Tax=Emydomyces testavorans TaxID=2070801 RepID=A0AAF0DQG9_9EURO|nr:hypothetical protein PRK78_006574 [Emydomyces testavorans]
MVETSAPPPPLCSKPFHVCTPDSSCDTPIPCLYSQLVLGSYLDQELHGQHQNQDEMAFQDALDRCSELEGVVQALSSQRDALQTALHEARSQQAVLHHDLLTERAKYATRKDAVLAPLHAFVMEAA